MLLSSKEQQNHIGQITVMENALPKFDFAMVPMFWGMRNSKLLRA